MFGMKFKAVIGLVSIKDEITDYAPNFQRIYTVSVNDDVTLKITCQSGIFSRRNREGQLSQNDGKSVNFDLNNVAEKILDKALVPVVEDFCRQITQLDKDYFAKKPDSYTDKDGTTWKRVK